MVTVAHGRHRRDDKIPRSRYVTEPFGLASQILAGQTRLRVCKVGASSVAQQYKTSQPERGSLAGATVPSLLGSGLVCALQVHFNHANARVMKWGEVSQS